MGRRKVLRTVEYFKKLADQEIAGRVEEFLDKSKKSNEGVEQDGEENKNQ